MDGREDGLALFLLLRHGSDAAERGDRDKLGPCEKANFSAKYRATQRFFARARELGVNEHSFEHTHQDWSLTSRERVYRDE